jgi:hypothetical protein
MTNKDQKSLESIYSKILLREDFDSVEEMPDEAPSAYSVSGDSEKKKALAHIFAQHNLPASEDAIDDILKEFGLGDEEEVGLEDGGEHAAASDYEEGDLATSGDETI